jgi:hypothetical protein
MITESELALYTPEERKLLWTYLMRIERGSSSKRLGRTIKALVKLGVGEHLTFLGPAERNQQRSRNLYSAKKRAREELNAPNAQWITRTTNQGLKVTRVR